MHRSRHRKKRSLASRPKTLHAHEHKPVIEREDLTATTLATDGRAIARSQDGTVIFIKNLLPGETARADIYGKKAGFKIATPVPHRPLLNPSPFRQTPPCPYANECGGCQLQHIAPESQTEFKASWLLETLRRVGKWENNVLLQAQRNLSIIPLQKEYYRRRIRVHYDGKRLGFRRDSSHEIIPISACLIADLALNSSLPVLRKNLEITSQETSQYTTQIPSFQCEIEITLTDEEQVIFHIADFNTLDRKKRENFKRILEKNIGIIPHQKIRLAHPELPHFKITAESFVQPHRDCGEAYYRHMKKNLISFFKTLPLLSSPRVIHAVDLYAGGGFFSPLVPLTAAQCGILEAHCTAVEGIADAVTSLQRNCKRTPHLKAICEDVDVFINKAFEEKLSQKNEAHAWDVVILDPPRTGVGILTMQRLVELCHSTSLILYLSCNPATFARDSHLLLEGGFSLQDLILFDSFGYTSHYEVLGCFVRKGCPEKKSFRG